jgi:alginate O-acetyltransferase complex protein AlgJ
MIGSIPKFSFARLRSRLRAPAGGRLADRLAIAVFALFLVAPFVGHLVRKPKLPVNENRPLHPRPDWPAMRWQWISFPFMFDHYFNDRVGFRTELLALRRRIHLDALGDSTSDLVWLGRDGWLFTNNIGPNNLPPPDAEQRLNNWVDALRSRRDWLAARGIRYLVVVAPEKSSIYPEFLPDAVRRHPPPEYGALLRERLGDFVLDPTDGVLAEKATTPQLYFRLDTHWTDAGAFPAYQTLGARLGRELPGFRTKPSARFRTETVINDNADLAKALGRPKRDWVEDMPMYHVTHDPIVRLSNDPILTKLRELRGGLRHVQPLAIESPVGVGRAVLLHDSFGHNLVRMLASDFRRLVCAGTYGFPKDVIEAEKPDVVIQLLVARAVTQTEAKPIRLD